MSIVFLISTQLYAGARVSRVPILDTTKKQLTDTTFQLEEVQVNTGYQIIGKERATGSYSFVDSALFNRRISTNVLERIENMTTGVLFDHTEGNHDPLLIRGRSSLYSDAAPLIVVDNFPYEGDLSNLNPNDVSSVTVLKDAAAASIWGARAGNGVIVISTKKGKTEAPALSLTSNTTIIQRPDLYALPIISSADYIELEKQLFKEGFYTSNINNSTSRPPLTPVVEILANIGPQGYIEEEAYALIEPFKRIDARDDLYTYFYQHAVNQQYNANVSGKSDRINYYFSAGYDQNKGSLVGTRTNRLSLRNQTSFRISNRLAISSGITYTQNNRLSGNNTGISTNSGASKGLYPYANLVDDSGHALPLVRDFRDSFTDTLGGGALLDWKYRPYEDINRRENTASINDFLIQGSFRYELNNWLQAEASYQYEKEHNVSRDYYHEDAYYVRNLVNRYYQPSATEKFPIPIGGIITGGQQNSTSHQGRFQLNADHSFAAHHITAIAGWEIREIAESSSSSQSYGYYKAGNLIRNDLDYSTSFPQYNNRNLSAKIPLFNSVSTTLDRFISYYANAAYTYKGQYTLSASARKDAANLFGVSSNMRGVPLWSVGSMWNAAKATFMQGQDLFSLLNLRLSYGKNGNINRSTSAMTTISFQNPIYTIVPLQSAVIVNPPNEKLRWEQIAMLNASLQFSLKNNRLSGQVSWYRKAGKDLLANAPIDPSKGVLGDAYDGAFFGNVAHMGGKGWELELKGQPLTGRVKWQSSLLGSIARTWVSKYLMPVGSGSSYLYTNSVSPVIGKPLYSVYSYPWAGLNPTDGAAMGYVNGEPSMDYNHIIAGTPLDSMQYHGSAQPTVFGAWRNTFVWKTISLSANISFKSGYYLRSTSVSYGSIMNTWTGHSDYAKRWQKPGDELTTTVPALQYPVVNGAYDFYSNSAVLVVPGAHIRLEDIQFSVDLLSATVKKYLKLSSLRANLYLSNLGTLWVQNKKQLDPYYLNSAPIGTSYAIGLHANF